MIEKILDFLIVILIAILPIMLVLLTFKTGRNVVLKLLKLLFFILLAPFHLVIWGIRYRKVKAVRNNYEILGKYIVFLGNNPEIIGYFKNLIESGIKPKKLEKLLIENIKKVNSYEIENQKRLVKAKMVEEHDFYQKAKEHDELLVKARLSLEQIKLKEKLLDNLYQKIQKKYRL